MQEIKSGVYTLVDLQKINALLDMRSDVEQQAFQQSPEGGDDNWS